MFAYNHVTHEIYNDNKLNNSICMYIYILHISAIKLYCI